MCNQLYLQLALISQYILNMCERRNVFEQGGATIARGGHHQHFRSDMMPRAMYGIHGHARNAISHVSQHRTAQNEMHARQVPRWSVVACTSSLKHYEKH